MRQIVVLAAAIALGAVTFAASAQTQKSTAAATQAGSVSKATQDFIKKAAITDMFEIQAGQLAQQKATDNAYKDFGKMIVDDHTKSSDQLKSVAQKIPGAQVPADLNPGSKKNLDKLQAMNGAAFENAFKNAQVKGHEKAIKMFQTYSQKGDNAELKKFAQDTLPVLQKHLQQAQALPKPGAAASASAPSGNATTSGSSGAPAGKNGSSGKPASGGSAY